MKKLLTSLLALLTCFACATAVACGESGNNSSNTGSSNTGSSDTGSSDTGSEDDELQDAADYLEALYKEQNVETRQDYEVFPAIMGYPITWTVDVASGVTINATADKVTVDVDELLDENLTYVLTATVQDTESDRTVTVSFTRVVLAAPAIIPVAITEAPVEGTAYKFYTYQGNTAVDCYITGNMVNTYYFETTTDYLAGLDLYVKNVTGGFNLYHVSNDVEVYINVVKSGTHTNAKYQTLEENATPSVWTYNTTWNTISTTLSDGTYYLGCDGTYDTVEPQYKTEAGYFMGYLVTMVDRSTITPDVKVAESKAGLALAKTEFVGAAEVKLPVARHADVTVEWAVAEHANASLVDGKLVLTNPAEDTTVTLTATLTCGEVSDTKEFTITLKHATEGPITTIAGALAGAEGAEATFSGTVSKIYYAWDEGYQNMSFYVTDGTDTILVFRAGTKVVVGDEVTVTGTVTAYNGVNQIAQGATVTITSGGTETPPVETPTYSTPEEILTALYGLADGESLTGPFTLTGKITELDSYNNPTIVVEGFEDKPVYCYKLKVTNAVGDTITVTAGSMKNYQGTYEFMDCTLVTEDQGGTEEPPVDTPVEGAVTISIADVAAANSWANGTRYEAVTYNGVTFTTAGTAVGSWGLNTGKYYDTNKDWRVYQNEGGTLTITAEAGKTIASVKITYNNKNGGVILHNEAQVTSGTVITVNANSLTIGVGSSSGATNGNIQITSIEIVYAE